MKFTAALIALCVGGIAAHPAQGRDRIIIGLQRSDDARGVLRDNGGRLLRRLLVLRAVSATVEEDRSRALLERLRADPRVRYAERDRRVRAPRPLIGRLIGRLARKPNDDGYSVQDGLRDIHAPKAWNTRTDCGKVGILDSGVQGDHPDLKQNRWTNDGEKNDGRDNDRNGYVDDIHGVDLIKNRGSGGKDPLGHGTHVAGIIAGRGNNARGVAGVCWKARLMSLRIMDDEGVGYTSDAAAGIVYAASHGVHLLNASYGSYKASECEKDAIRYARKRDVLVVAAAGNDDRDADKSPSYPADYGFDNVISVAASTNADRLASFSNYGNHSVDLAAPGVEIASTWKGGNYRYVSGTSMATPFVTAAAAMVRKEGGGLPYTKVRHKVLNNVDKSKPFKGTTITGGRLNVARAVADA